MAEFKVPQTIPQDLLLIQEIVGPVEKPAVVEPRKEEESSSRDSDSDDDISSSGASSSEAEDGNQSEEEVAKGLVAVGDDSEPASAKESASEPSDSSSESSSDSESESDGKEVGKDSKEPLEDLDDEDPVPSTATGSYFHTKNEIVDADVTVPEIDEVGPDERLEKVGVVMSIVNQIAIVRGLPSEQLNKGAQTALDSETLLVFDDRKVMGYIYETFGPTSQPLYQVKFNSKYPLNPERVKVDREVFAVPDKTNFVFVEKIKAFKGSDASNVYDEEPADDELEFSDDEAEAAYRSRLKRKRAESRSRSMVPGSREGTPNPSHMRDHQLVDGNAFSEHGPYDLNYSEAGPSRPRPAAYDDPYANPYDAEGATSQSQPWSHANDDLRPIRGRGRGRGRGQSGRGHGRGGHGRTPSFNNPQQQQSWEQNMGHAMSEPYDPHSGLTMPQQPQQFTAPNMYPFNPGMGPQQHGGMNPAWTAGGGGYPQPNPMMQRGFGFDVFQQQAAMGMMPFVQPHINPRFAGSFAGGFPGAFQQQQQQQPPNAEHGGQQYPPQNGDNTQQWPSQ